VKYALVILFEKRLLAVSMDLLQETATLFPEAKHDRLSACAALSPDDRQRKGNILLFTVVGGVIGATFIGLGAYYLGDSLHRPTGPLGIALTVLVLCLFAICIRILLRNIHRLEDIAERMLPGPLDIGVGKKKQEAEQDH